MRYILDTHILIWWSFDPSRLSRTHTAALAKAEQSGEHLAISAITLREIAAVIARGRIESTVALDQLLSGIESHPLLDVIPLTAQIAAESVRLGADAPRDPADQIIMATARCHGLTLITADDAIRASVGIKLL